MTGNGLLKDRRSRTFLFLLFLALCTAGRCILSAFPKTGTACWDETLNLELAQNIRLYGRLTVYGLPSGQAGILYPALIAPFFGIGSLQARMTAISVLNALLISSAMIPAWLLCRDLLKRESHRIAALVLFAAAPAQWFSAAFTAECLYIPMALWTVWFLVRAFGKGVPEPGVACVLGLWCYLLFQTSQAGVAVLLGTAALFASAALRQEERKKALTGFLCFAAAFAGAYLLVMAVLYGGRLYGYTALAGGRISSPERLLFWLLTGICLLLWFAASLLFLPVTAAAAGWKRMEGAPRRIYGFLAVYTVSTALLTACSVFTDAMPDLAEIRVVLRFFIPAGWLFVLLFLALPEDKDAESLLRHPVVRMSVRQAVLCLLFLWIPAAGSLTDAPSLQALASLDRGVLHTVAVRTAAVMVIAAGTALWVCGKKKTVKACVLAALLVLGAVNGVLTLRRAGQEENPLSAELRKEAETLGAYLDGLEGSILTVAGDPGGDAQRLMDAYCNTDHYLIRTGALRQMAVSAEEPGIVRMDDAGWTEGQETRAMRKENEGIRADYIVCRSGELYLSGEQYEECTPEGVGFMRVYRNGVPDRIDARDLFALGVRETIRFTRENPDFLNYPVYGFSHPESGFTWTEGKEATIMVMPAAEPETPLALHWVRTGTNGEQECEVYADGILLYAGTISGYGEMEFPIPEELTCKGELITLRFVFPDARVPGNGDPRILAAQFETILLEER